MKILHLTLKKKWFDMIASGVKKEEYREIKRYWKQRLTKESISFKNFDAVLFRNGYSSNAPRLLVECKGVTIGRPKKEWSDSTSHNNVFVISLGKILKDDSSEGGS